MAAKNVLITGGTGFLGGYVLKAFQEAGFEVYNISRRTIAGTHSIQSDLADADINIPPIGFEKVVHIAGKAHVFPKTKAEGEAFYTVNLEGTKNLLQAMDKIGLVPRQFVFISTVAVYGLNKGKLLSEHFPPQPNTPYGDSKWMAEKVVQAWCASKGAGCLILRLPLIVGANPPGNLGDMRKAIAKGTYLSIKNNKAQKSVVLADDVAALIVSAAPDISGVFNLTDKMHPSFEQIETAIAERLNKKISIKLPLWILYPMAWMGDVLMKLLKKDLPFSSLRLEKIISTLTFDDSKASAQLNWRPKSAIEFIRQHI